MTIAVNPELAEALARIAELEAEIVQGDAADKINNAHTDSLEEALEELEVEIVGERAKRLEAERWRDGANEELAQASERNDELFTSLRDMTLEREELAGELKGAEADLAEKEKELKEAEEGHAVALDELGDILRDYLVATYGHSSGSLPRDLKRLCDAVGVNW